MQYVPNNSESKYLVSNDDLSVMDLPRNMKPGIPMSRNRVKTNKIPALIPPLKYIVYNNPQRVYDFLISKNYNVDNNIPSTYQFAKVYVRENGEPAILEIVKECHPDKELMLKAMNLNKESSFNGETKENETQRVPVQEIKKEETKDKKEIAKEDNGSGIKLNTQTVIIALIIVVFFLLINRANK
jgi:hypothetical protein